MEKNILALPSKYKFRDQALKLLREAGAEFELKPKQVATEAFMSGFGDFILALLRPSDAIRMIGDRRIPVAIVGEDTTIEFSLTQAPRASTYGNFIASFDIGRSRLVLAAPKGSNFKSLEEIDRPPWEVMGQFSGKTISAALPNTVRSIFRGVNYRLQSDQWIEPFVNEDLTGSLEAANKMGLADAVADIVETGTSLEDNNLKEIITLNESRGVLVTGYNNLELPPFVEFMKTKLSPPRRSPWNLE